jgi:hypothetical protein
VPGCKQFKHSTVHHLPDRFQSINTHWLLPQSGNAEPMALALILIVKVVVRDGSMGGDPVIPQRNCLIIPLDANLDILALGNVLQGFSQIRRVNSEVRHTLKSNCSMASDSSSFNPTILFVKPGLTNKAFSPVAYGYQLRSRKVWNQKYRVNSNDRVL